MKNFENDVWKEIEKNFRERPLKYYFNNYESFLEDSVSHKVILKMCRGGIISTEKYGKILKMLWSDDPEICNLAYEIIKNLQDETKNDK